MVCLGCGNRIPHPFGANVLQFRYRISEMLLRVLEHDALGHLLTLHWFVRFFHSGTDAAERLVGGHPGVSFFRDDVEIGEADVLLLFSDGSCAVGEYKKSAKGLNAVELGKFERLADALDADWTFTATHDFSADCTELWRSCRRGLPDRPHFSLTGDHLYRYVPWILGKNPFVYADDPDAELSQPIADPASAAERVARFAHPDVLLLDRWEAEDQKAIDDSIEQG